MKGVGEMKGVEKCEGGGGEIPLVSLSGFLFL